MTSNQKLNHALQNAKEINLTFRQSQKLKKGKAIRVVINYEAYKIVPCELPKELLGYSKEQLRIALKAKGVTTKKNVAK